MMIDLRTFPEFSCEETLKEISHDRANREYMTESKVKAVDFDQVASDYEKRWGLKLNRPSSADALYYDKEHQVFIEFKNGDLSHEIKKVKKKIRDSILMFCDITDSNMRYTRENMVFILVYNEEKSPKSNIKAHFTQKAQMETVRFGLSVYGGSYFKRIHTLTAKEFDRYLEQISPKTPKGLSLSGTNSEKEESPS